MARQVLPIVGAVVGAFFGYPQLGFAVGSIVGNLVDPAISQGPKMGELPVQTSNEGQPRSIIYGTSTCTGYIIAFGPPLKTTEILTGEKGAPKSEVEVVYRNYAIAICEGPIAAVLRVWQNDKVVYDVRPGSLMLAESAKWIANKAIYLGGEDQLPDIYLQLNVSGVGETPAFRGTAYMVVGLEDLTDTQGAIPQYRWEVAGTASLSEELRPLIVYPWVQGAINPQDERNEHTYRYVGYTPQSGNPQSYPHTGSDLQTELADAVADAITAWNTSGGVSVPPSISGLHLIGNSLIEPGNVTFSMFPAYPNVAVEQERLLLHYNEQVPGGYTPPGDYPLLSASLPDFPNSLWGAQNPQGACWYVASLYTHLDQFQSPDRHFSTEVFTNSGVRDGEKFLTYDALIELRRVPIAPVGFTKVVGTAKQLAALEYRSENLYQLGLGPVLLPGDPNYDNATFWADARAAAILANTIETDVSSPIVVSAYARGYDSAGGDPIPLSGIVADLCDRARLSTDDYDTSELTDDVLGMTLTGDYTAADAINTLRSCYFFDKAEPGDKIYFPKRGKPVVATLTIDDLVDVPDTSRREQVSEVPKKLHLLAMNPTAGYAPVMQTAERSSVDVLAVAETTVSVPVVLTVDDQARMAHKIHKVMAADAQGEIKLTVPDQFIRLVPSDCIGLVLRNQVMRLRIDESEWADGILSLTLRLDRQSAYTSAVTGIPIPEPTLPPSTIAGETILALIDISPRQDSEDDLHILVAGSGASDGWPGWALQRSLDGGANWTTVDTFTSAAVMGSLVDAVADASEDYTDTTNTVRVQLLRDSQTLESITDAQFLSEGGAFALEKPDGSYEVMQYLDANEDSNGIFELSTLHRGRLNSGTAAHTAGAKFVMLQTAEHIVMESAWIGAWVKWRAVSLGESPELADIVTSTYVGRSQIEWEVASLTLSRASNIVTAAWAPRHRLGTEDVPVASSNFTGYRVTIVGTSTVTFDQITSGFTYDVSAIGGGVTVSVSALNRYTGAGPSTTGSI